MTNNFVILFLFGELVETVSLGSKLMSKSNTAFYNAIVLLCSSVEAFN